MEKHEIKDLTHACTIHITACEACIDHCQKFIASCSRNTDEIVCAKEVGIVVNACTIAMRTGKNLLESCMAHQSCPIAECSALIKKCAPLTKICVDHCKKFSTRAKQVDDTSKKAALECIKACTESAQACSAMLAK